MGLPAHMSILLSFISPTGEQTMRHNNTFAGHENVGLRASRRAIKQLEIEGKQALLACIKANYNHTTFMALKEIEAHIENLKRSKALAKKALGYKVV